MIGNYLQLLIESLEKKLNILEILQDYSNRQADILKSPDVSLERYDECVDEKDRLVRELAKLDDGFEKLYDNIKEELLTNKKQYQIQIATLQELISKLTEKNCNLQAQEERNKTLLDNYFQNERKALRGGRKASKAALDYYQSMSGSKVVQPQFLDKKK